MTIQIKKLSLLILASISLQLAACAQSSTKAANTTTSQANLNTSRKTVPTSIATPEVTSNYPQKGSILAIGDLHGDLEATKKAFQIAGITNQSHHWVAPNIQVVQLGDQLDRGDDDLAIIQYLEQLEQEAKEKNSVLHVLNGNHELMNSQLDMRYVTLEGFKTFDKLKGLDFKGPIFTDVPDHAKARVSAMKPGGPIAKKFAKRKAILNIDGNIFVHGGLLPEHINYGIDKINQEYTDWFLGKSKTLNPDLFKTNSPFWTRIYSDPLQAADCKTLEKTLKMLNAKRMIVAHTVQPQINSACNQQVWRIDVGMSKAYKGKTEVLSILGDTVTTYK